MLDRVTFPAGLLLVATTLACGNEAKIKELTKKYRPAIDQNLAALPGVASQVRGLPPLAEDRVEPLSDIVLAGFSGPDEPATAALSYAEDLADPVELGYVWGRLDKTGALNHCASLIHNGHLAYDPAQPKHGLRALGLTEAKAWLPDCARYKYLLVFRTLEFTKPSQVTLATRPFAPLKSTADSEPTTPPPALAATKKSRRPSTATVQAVAAGSGRPGPDAAVLLPEESSPGKKITRYMFEGGQIRAEVLVFALPSAKLLGGFRVKAQSSLEINGTDSAIEEDLKAQIKAAMVEGMKHTLPRMPLANQGS
jgi:hypothetical protein